MTRRDLLRRIHIPLTTVLEAHGGLPLLLRDPLDADSLRVRRTVLLGACSAAAAHLAASPTASNAETAFWVDTEHARSCFEMAQAGPDRSADLAAVFRPTAFLFEENLRGRCSTYSCRDDDGALGGIHTGIAALVRISAARTRVLGEAYFVPPIGGHDDAAGAIGSRALQLEPPRRGEPAGPFWRLGRQSLWRLDVLAWNEILVLAALVGTTATEAVVVAPRHLLPRVGFVAEVARAMQRRLIGVPLDSCPRPLRGMLRDLPRVDCATETTLYWDPSLEGVVDVTLEHGRW